MKKIAIVGAQSSGKTTSLYYLCYRLKEARKKIGIGHEVARECPYPLNEEGGFKTQFWILYKQIEREESLEEWYEKIILDRSVFDVIAYANYLTRLGRIKKKDYEFIRKMALDWAKKHPYTLIIYLDPLPREEDPMRGSNTQKYQDEIVKSLEGVIREMDCPVVRVKIAPKERRCMEVYHIVRENLYGRNR